MNAKKIIAIILALVLCVGLLAGCGPKAPSTPGTSEKPGTPAPGEPAKEGVTEIVVQMINFGYTDPDLQMVQDAINEISEAKIGVRVKFLTTPISEMATKLSLAVAGGEQIDLVCAGLLTNPAGLVAQGLLQPITQYIKASDVLYSKAGDMLTACTVNGEIYAYPGTYYAGQGLMLVYDQELADEYGIKMPASIESQEELTAIFQQVVDSGMPVYAHTMGDGVNAERNYGYRWEGLGDAAYGSYGVILDQFNGTEIVNWFETAEYKHQVELHQQWFEAGYLVPDSISNGIITYDSLAAGQAFSFMAPFGTGQGLAWYESMTGRDLGSVMLGTASMDTHAIIETAWGVPVNSTNVEAAIKFAELINSDPEVGTLYNFGIEGVHYVRNEGSRVISYPEGVDPSASTYGAFIPMFGDMMELPVKEPNDESFYDVYKALGPDAKVGKYVGYTFDASNVSAQVAAVQAVVQKYAPALNVGCGDVETMLPQFISELKAAGIDEIIAENQKQVDAWLASN